MPPFRKIRTLAVTIASWFDKKTIILNLFSYLSGCGNVHIYSATNNIKMKNSVSMMSRLPSFSSSAILKQIPQINLQDYLSNQSTANDCFEVA